MTNLPNIAVQLVHITGPLKGEIQEIFDPEISIGRFPNCQVRFPVDFIIISRNHARISRDGNRFKLIDSSTNGTFVNGNRITEHYLKSGDVITFTEDGPKVSFLTRVETDQPESPKPVTPESEAGKEIKLDVTAKVPVLKVKAGFVIQYGATLRSFKELPIIIGKDPDCEFILEHPEIHGHHARFFFREDKYWVEDMTGKNLVSVDGNLIGTQSVLNPDNILAFSPGGPRFRFLGGGRLAEYDG